MSELAILELLGLALAFVRQLWEEESGDIEQVKRRLNLKPIGDDLKAARRELLAEAAERFEGEG